MPNKLKKLIKKIRLRWHHPILGSVFILSVLILSVFFGRKYALSQIGQNVYVNDIHLSGMTYEAASELLEDEFSSYSESKVEVSFHDEVFEFTLAELGLEFDTVQTIEHVYLADYGENLWDGMKSQVYRLFNEVHIEPVVHADITLFEDSLKSQIEDLNEPQNALVLLNEEGSFAATTHQDGLTGQYEEAYEVLQLQMTQLDELSIQLDTEVLYANLTGELAESAAELANHYTSDTFTFVYTTEYASKEYSMSVSPEWVSFVEDETGVLSVEIDRSELENFLNESLASDIDQEVEHASLTALPAEGSDYAEVEGVAKDGKTLMVDETIENFLAALEEDIHEIEVVVDVEPGTIMNETGENLGELTLLASGVSNWEGSPDGRDYNVRKGLNEKVNNILLAPGEEYDFNKNLGPVTNSAGWENSLAIFRGSELIPVPGGGLCQVSTTVYRAAINAGLEITERSNHSLYVHYYKEYGDGLDAAIYPGSKNLRFVNDTENYMLIQAYDDGYDGFVNIYGTPDGREVELIGPFYPSDIPEEWQDRISLAYNQIGWWQVITDADGNVLEEKQLTGSYRSIPY